MLYKNHKGLIIFWLIFLPIFQIVFVEKAGIALLPDCGIAHTFSAGCQPWTGLQAASSSTDEGMFQLDNQSYPIKVLGKQLLNTQFNEEIHSLN